jgi:hypothetical protein
MSPRAAKFSPNPAAPSGPLTVYTGACAAHGRHHVVRTPRVTHKLVVARHISASLSGVDLHTAREPVYAEPQGRSQSTSIREECHSRGFGTFGFGSTAKCATRPAENNIGSPEIWERATAALRRAAELAGLPLTLDEGGGAFYGPKIDFKIKDALGREWQNATVQCDFNLPERFELKFTDSDGVEKRPIMVHRAILGSMSRPESCAGPAGASPVAVIAGEPRSRPQCGGEILRTERGVESPQAGVRLPGGEQRRRPNARA